MENTFALPHKNDVQYQEKLARLKFAREHLRKVFIGIDQQIDQVIDAIRTWYLFPGVQKRPTVINLWGMTGVGKTDLIQHLLVVLELEDVSEVVDCTDDSSVQRRVLEVLDEFVAKRSNSRVVLVMDEFQHMRTLDKEHKELLKNTVFWQLLDRGEYKKPIQWDALFRCEYALHLLREVKQIVEKDDEIYYSKGRIYGVNKLFSMISRAAGFFTVYERFGDNGEEKYFEFVSSTVNHDLNRLLDREMTDAEIDGLLYEASMEEVLALIERALEVGKKPQMIDCPDSLVITLGNLDDAYPLTGSDDADMDADSLYKLTSKITYRDIHQALQIRFRPEHIARLGNQHIIYPSLSRNAFEQIEDKMFSDFSADIRGKLNIQGEITFSDALHALVYNEGVAPAMGVRNLRNAFDRTISRHLGTLIELAASLDNSIQSLHFDVEEFSLLIDWKTDRGEGGLLKKELHLPILKARKSVTQNEKALYSVHEAGHAILAMLELNEVPHIMRCTSYDGRGAFVLMKPNEDVKNKSKLFAQGVTLVGGLVAEELFFGDGMRSGGARKDLLQLTGLANSMVAHFGMGKELYPNYLLEEFVMDRVDNPGHPVGGEVSYLLNLWRNRAQEVLRREQNLLRALALALFEREVLLEEEIEAIVREHAVELMSDRNEQQEYAGMLLYANQLNGQWSLCDSSERRGFEHF